MKLSSAILLFGALAFSALLLAQYRWIDADAASFGRKRLWTLIAGLALFGVLASAHRLAVEAETPTPEPGLIIVEGPEEPPGDRPVPPLPPPPRPPVARQQDCPAGTILAAGRCRTPAEEPIREE